MYLQEPPKSFWSFKLNSGARNIVHGLQNAKMNHHSSLTVIIVKSACKPLFTCCIFLLILKTSQNVFNYISTHLLSTHRTGLVKQSSCASSLNILFSSIRFLVRIMRRLEQMTVVISNQENLNPTTVFNSQIVDFRTRIFGIVTNESVQTCHADFLSCQDVFIVVLLYEYNGCV